MHEISIETVLLEFSINQMNLNKDYSDVYMMTKV